MNYYDGSIDTIHLKFGDMRKQYSFTDDFRKKHPNFCKEYEKYWEGDPTCRFKNALEIAQYIGRYDIPVHLYFNYTDTPVEHITEVYSYLIREYAGISRNEDGSWRKDYDKGLDGEEPNDKHYEVKELKDE